MKGEITSMDLYYLLRELKELQGGKVDKIFQKLDDKKDFLFRFHVPGAGRRMLRIRLPGLIYLSEYKEEYPDIPPGYCMFLRKYLGNSRLTNVAQHNFERILLLDFENKSRKEAYMLIVELFSKGNMILCDEGMKIKSPLENQNWGGRTIRGNTPYKFPPEQVNTPSLDEGEFTITLKKSDKQSIVKALAMDLSIGGKYSEELCARANIDKNAPLPITEKQYSMIFSEWKKMLTEEPHPVIVEEHILPYEFKSIKGKPKSYTSLSRAIDDLFQPAEIVPDKTKLVKTERIISAQQEKLKSYALAAEENQAKGEYIYEHYKEIEQILLQLRKAREKYSWKEIQQRLQDHKTIKQIDEKTSRITLEL